MAQKLTNYPKSHKPFRSPASFIELDFDLSDAIESDMTFTVTIPRASSRREAMRLVHRQASKVSAKVMLGAQSDHTASAVQAADASILQSLVEEVAEQACRPELAEEFGLPRPLTAKISQEAIKAPVDHLYGKVYDALNRKLEADAKAERQSHEAQAANLATVETTSPKEVLDQYVKHSVRTELRNRGHMSADDEDMEPAPEAQQVVDALQVPKNGASPPAGVGH